MALVNRWDIREETYSNGASITSLTDQQGDTDLTTDGTVGYPTYNSTLDAIEFAASEMIGSASLGADLAAAPKGSAWSLIVLCRQSTLTTDFLAGWGQADANASVFIRTNGSGTVRMLVREAGDSGGHETASTSTRTADTWEVVHLIYDGTDLNIGVENSGIGSVTRTEDLASDTWTQFGLGAYYRSSIGNYWTGFIQEVRVYDTDETSNLSTIISSMKAGGGPGDSTAPVLTSPTAGSLTTDGVTPSVTTDEGNGTLYWGIYADAASPTAAQVVAGTSAILSGSQAVSGTGSQAVSAQTGLDDATSYELFFVHDDAAANRSNLSTVGFTTSTDSTAPSLTSPTAGSVTSTSVAPTVTTDTAEGTAYARVYADGATPTNSQVQSGTGVTPVASATNITVGASGALNFSAITGLTEGTAYELYFAHEDDATTPNLSAVSTVGFTTTSAARSVELTGANGYELRDETGAVIASLNGIVWEWYDDPDSTIGTPTDSGTFNTSAGGEATITITGSSLADGAFGQLIIRHPTDDEIRGNYYLPVTVS